MALTITIPGAIEATTGATAPAVLTIGVGIPGPGVPTGGTAGQVLKKLSSTNYDTAWQTDLNSGVWGSITGTLSSQTDLQNALDAKLGTSTAASTYYPLTNPSAYITASALTPYLTTSAASSTYQTQAGMSSYLTTSAAASTYAPIAAGQPTSGTVGQVLTKASGTNYDSTWTTIIPGDRYLSSSSTSLTISTGAKSLTIGTGLSYSSQQDIVIAYDAANHMHAVVTSYNSGTGALVVDVQNKTGSGTYSAWTVNVGGTVPLQTVSWGDIVGTLGNQTDLATALNAKLDTSTASSTYAALAGAVFTGEVATPASTISTAGFSIAPGTAPTTPTNGEIWNTGTELVARISGVSETLARQSWVTGQGYLTSSALTPYAPLAGATFTGLVSTPASTTTTAGLRIAHGAAPTTPVNGDVWTTTGGFFWRQNGTTYQAVNLSGTQTVSGAITFSNATLTLGNSTAAATYNLGTGATLTATTKAINIGTAGVAGSTTNIAVGSATSTTTTTVEGTITANGATLNLGTSTAAATYNLGTGATLTATTKAVNIGTNGVAGSTTNIAIGSTTGTSTTTLQGSTVGTTLAADTNTTGLATTAFVVGQAGSATPIVDGTASVGTSLRYARQDHVHPTDTSRAPLAAPTFTGIPAAPTAAVDTNTTQIATTAYVVGQGYAKLASPTFTGTPTLPTGTIATTQSPGNNTTAVATTAFVTAAVPVIATAAQTITGTSATVALSPSTLGAHLTRGLSQRFDFISTTSTSGSGQVTTSFGGFREMYLSSVAIGRSSFALGSVGTSTGCLSGYSDESKIDYSKKIWVAGRATTNFNATYIGDANTSVSCAIGGFNTNTTGDMNVAGIGWRKAGGSGAFVTLMVHNGTTFTTVATTKTVATLEMFDWLIYSDGTGNVTLYINGVSSATTSSGPTGLGGANQNIYREQVEGTTGLAKQMLMHSYGGCYYSER